MTYVHVVHGWVWKWGQQVGGNANWPCLGGASGGDDFYLMLGSMCYSSAARTSCQGSPCYSIKESAGCAPSNGSALGILARYHASCNKLTLL